MFWHEFPNPFFMQNDILEAFRRNQMFKKLTLLTLAASAYAVELTPDTWDEHTAGKTVFVKFFAPWCGHCKAMKPAWDSLMDEYSSSETVLIADVDCIGAGKDLCETVGVKGFPTIKFGDPSSLEDYKGGRDLDTLKTFASELKPVCNIATHDNCDAEQAETVAALKEVSVEDLEQKVKDHDEKKADIETTFQEGVQGLQKQYEDMSKTKDDGLMELAKSSNIGLVKSVLAFKKSSTDEL